MYELNRIILFFCSLMLPFCIYSQSIKVVGTVMNQNHLSVEAASVVLMRDSDHRLLEYCITGQQGNFTLHYNKEVACQLVVRHLSYGTVTIPLPGQCDTTLTIVLSTAMYDMEEVNIVGKRVPVQFENGDWIVNVENFITPGTERSMDVLRKLPGIVINEKTKKITMYGKDVELKLNGILQPMTFELLNALPSKLVNQIVLTPIKRAEHDGLTDNAIINIKTKKKYIDGFLGNADLSDGLDIGNNLPGDKDGTFFVMLMKKNFYLNLMLSGYTYSEDSNVSDSIWYNSTHRTLVEEQYIRSKNEWGTASNVNLSWDVKNGNRLNVNLYLSNDHKYPELTSYQYGSSSQKSTHFRKDHMKQFNPSGNIEYEASKNFPFELKTSYGYIGVERDEQYDYQNRYKDMPSDDYSYFYELSGMQHILKLDVKKHFLNKRLLLNIGGKANFARTKNKVWYEPVSSSRMAENFDYKEQVATGFFLLSYDCSDKISINARLNADYTHYYLSLAAENLSSANHYWNLLPLLSLNFNVNKNYISVLNFSTDIKRPTYNALTPKVTYVNEHFYYTGNPLLIPSKVYNVDCFNLFFRIFSISTSWEYTKDLYTSVLTDRGNQVTESSYKNCFDEWRGLIKLNVSLNLLDDHLNLNSNVSWIWGRYRNFRDGFLVPRNRNTSLEGALNFVYWMTKNNRLKMYGNVKLNIFNKSFQVDEKANVHANIGLRFKCLANRSLYISFYGTDIFNSSGQEKIFYYDHNIRYRKETDSYQGFTIGLSYSFQGGKDLKRNEVDDDVNADEKRYD